MQEMEIKQVNLDFRSKEAFKTLRTNVEFSGDSNRVICITSTTPNEGKSTVSFELANSFAENGKKTLLVDADLRKSVMRARNKKGKLRYGMTNYLAGQADLEETICETDIENLDMIFAGPVPPNPSELLGGEKFDSFLRVTRKAYDIIIIDTPPIGSVIDAAIIAKQCDGVIIVIGSALISYHYARKAKEQMEVAGCKILGAVLNKVKMTGQGYYKKYYGKYYGNYTMET